MSKPAQRVAQERNRWALNQLDRLCEGPKVDHAAIYEVLLTALASVAAIASKEVK